MTTTVAMISSRIARDVGVVELADRLDQVLADAAGADEAHHGGAAHVDLEAQQRVAGEVRQHLRQHREADRSDPARAGRSRTLDRLHVDVLDHLGEQLAERARRCGSRCASTPGIGPSPKATTKISAKTISGTVRQNSRKRRPQMRTTGAACQVGGASEAKAESRRSRRAACRDRRSAACRPAAAASSSRPQNHSARSVQTRAPVSSVGEMLAEVVREAVGYCRRTSRGSTSPAIAGEGQHRDNAELARRRATMRRRLADDGGAIGARSTCASCASGSAEDARRHRIMVLGCKLRRAEPAARGTAARSFGITDASSCAACRRT